MVEYSIHGTGRIEVFECSNAREFFNEIRDYDVINNDDNHLFVQYRDGTTWASGFNEGRPKKTNVVKAIFENDYIVIHFNGTIIKTTDSTGYVYVEVV